jgi:hypothetical protein
MEHDENYCRTTSRKKRRPILMCFHLFSYSFFYQQPFNLIETRLLDHTVLQLTLNLAHIRLKTLYAQALF